MTQLTESASNPLPLRELHPGGWGAAQQHRSHSAPTGGLGPVCPLPPTGDESQAPLSEPRGWKGLSRWLLRVPTAPWPPLCLGPGSPSRGAESPAACGPPRRGVAAVTHTGSPVTDTPASRPFHIHSLKRKISKGHAFNNHLHPIRTNSRVIFAFPCHS